MSTMIKIEINRFGENDERPVLNVTVHANVTGPAETVTYPSGNFLHV